MRGEMNKAQDKIATLESEVSDLKRKISGLRGLKGQLKEELIKEIIDEVNNVRSKLKATITKIKQSVLQYQRAINEKFGRLGVID